MNFHAPTRTIVIYGGIDDIRNLNEFPAYYTDLAILDLITFVWITV